MSKAKFNTSATAKKFLSNVIPGTEETKEIDDTTADVTEAITEGEEPLNIKKAGRRANKEKNIQVSIYLTPAQAKELRIQNALKEKESDKSAIARTGIDIALALSNDEYTTLKTVAQQQGKTVGKIVSEALAIYLSNE